MATENTTDTDTSTEDVSGLKNKIAELHRKLKAETARAEEAERDRDEAADNAKAETGTELEKANRTIAKLNKDLEAANQRADTSDKAYRTYRATAALNEAITANNVDSKFASDLSRAYKHDIEFSDSGEPTIDGKPIDAYFKSYFAKDGLHYVRADVNNGGVSQGHEGAKATAWTRMPSTSTEWQEFDKIPTVERNAICDQNGWDNLKL